MAWLIKNQIDYSRGYWKFLVQSSQGGEVLKILSVGHRLNLISRIQEKTVARNFCSFSSEALQSL